MKLDVDQQRLVTDHLWLVREAVAALAQRFTLYHTREEIKGAAYLGLCLAARKYEGDRHVEFYFYAKPRIYGSIQDVLRQEVPLGFRRPRAPGGTGQVAATAWPNVVSLGPEGGAIVEGGGEVGALLEATDGFRALVRFLDRHSAVVVRDYYERGLSIRQIARLRKVTEKQVNRIHNKAIAVLRWQLGASA